MKKQTHCRRWTGILLCLSLLLSLWTPAAGAIDDKFYTIYLPATGKGDDWNICHVFTAEKDAITLTLQASGLVTNYEVKLATTSAGDASTDITPPVSVPIGCGATFSGLMIGQMYQLLIRSNTAPDEGCSARYRITIPEDAGTADGGSAGYSVKFYFANRAEIAVQTFVQIRGQFPLPEAPTRKGYDFEGWSDGRGLYQPGQIIDVQEDMTFDATWKASNPPRHPFTDLDEYGAYFDDVMYVYENGLMNGASPTVFGLDRPVTRATLWTVLARLNKVDTTGGETWYSAARQWAMDQGITDGTLPEKLVSRQEMFTMFYRLSGSPAVTQNSAHAFRDMDQIALWARDAVLWTLDNNLLAPYYRSGELKPAQDALRWEIVCLTARYAALDS